MRNTKNQKSVKIMLFMRVKYYNRNEKNKQNLTWAPNNIQHSPQIEVKKRVDGERITQKGVTGMEMKNNLQRKGR